MTLAAAGRDWRFRKIVHDVVKYGAASAAALALDYALLLFFYEVAGFDYLAAAAIGFLSGLLLVYFLSIRFVFNDRRSAPPAMEFCGFCGIGVAGLLLNEFLMHTFVEDFDLAVALAKVPTAGLVFTFNFTARRAFLFSTPARGEAS